MAGVVEQRRAHLTRLAGDPRDEQRVVGRLVGVVAAGEPLRRGVPEIPVGRQRAAAGAVRHPRRRSGLARLEDRCAELLGQVLDVGLDQLGAGLVGQLRVDVRAGMGVRHVDQQRGVVQPRALQERRAQLLLVRHVLEPAEVDCDERERRPVAAERREDGCRGGERPVDSLGGVVRGGAPAAGVDPDRRRDIPRGNAEAAVRVAKGLVHCQPSPLLNDVVGRALRAAAGWPASMTAAPGDGDEYGAGAGDRERKLRAAACGEPAGEQAAERRPAEEREHVEARRLSAQVLRCSELQRRERARAPEQVAAAGQEEQDADRREARLRGERELEHAEAERAADEQANARLAEGGEEERAAKSAGAEDGRDQAEHVRVGVECVPGEQREQHVEVERDRAQREHREEGHRHPARATNEREHHADAPAESGLHLGRDVRAELADPHREQRDHDREVAGGVHGECDADPGQGDDEPAERRPDDARGRPQGRAERDRVRQVVLPHDPEHERVPGRVAEHEDEPLEGRDHVHLPERDGVGQRQDGERSGSEDRERLGHEQQPADVEAVDHRADGQAEERHRQELGEGERSDGERRSGQVEHEPVRSDLLHPRTDERDAVADEVEPVVPVLAQARERPSAHPREKAHVRRALADRSAGRS